jgi:RNA polymerase sigma factor (TIGR02999 family)
MPTPSPIPPNSPAESGASQTSKIAEIMEVASRQGFSASEELLPLVYEELKILASQRMSGEGPGQTLQPTALVHEAWLRLTTNSDRAWNDRAHFFRAAALAMRRILVNRARAKSRDKRGSNPALLDISGLEIADPSQDDRIVQVDDMLARLEPEDPESARVVTLKFFGGLTNKEIAAMDGVSERTVERQWAYARGRLYQMILEDT